MGENGLRVPPVFVYNADMRKKGINMSRVSLWAAVCLLSSFSIQAETVAPEGCGLSGRIGELPHLYAPPMLGNGDVTCAFEPDGGMSTNNFSRLVPGIYRAGRRRPLPDCGLFCFGCVKSVWAIDGKDVVDGIWKQTLDTRRAVLENRRASRDVHERMTAFGPMGRAYVMVRKTVRNVGTETRRVRFGIGYEIPDDPFVVGGWSEENAGTRAYAARWIGHRLTAGRVTVNGQVVTELGSKVDPLLDQVAVDGVPVRLEGGPVTIMLHKPAGYVTTMSDPQGRPTVAELVPTDRFPGLFPIGRLDFDTTGLLLFSTNGELGNGLLHPRHHVEKRYLALVNGKPTPEQLAQLEQGIQLDDGMTAPAKAALVEGAEAKRALSMLEVPPAVPDHEPNGSVPSPQRAAILRKRSQQRAVVRVVLREGRKRQVKRMLSAIKHGVLALHRDSFGPIELGDLPRGKWRELTPEEVAALHASIK